MHARRAIAGYPGVKPQPGPSQEPDRNAAGAQQAGQPAAQPQSQDPAVPPVGPIAWNEITLGKRRTQRSPQGAPSSAERRRRTAVPPPPLLTSPFTHVPAGVPRETLENERRVALTPASVAALLKSGFKAVVVEKGAGEGARFTVRGAGRALAPQRGDAAPPRGPASH